jgi:mannosylfructose-phosphate synthase
MDQQLSASGPRIAMISTHGYVAKTPPLGAADTGGQVVYVLELSKKLAELGYQVDIWTRQFEEQAAIEPVGDRVRIIRIPCGGRAFIPKEHLHESLGEWCKGALDVIEKNELRYELINSHYWDAGVAGATLASRLHVPHAHTPHSLGIWKQRQMENEPGGDPEASSTFNFDARIQRETQIYRSADLVVATTPQQRELIIADYGISSDKCKMIPPGYDDTRFFPVSEATRQAIRKLLGF